MRSFVSFSMLVVSVHCGDNGGGAPAIDAARPDVPADAMPRQVVTEDVPLVATEIAEAILAGGEGDYARLKMTAPSASLDWNIHGHANGTTQVVNEELGVMTVDYLFQPPAQADWYLLLRNHGATDMTVHLELELYGDLTWSGWQ